MKYCSKCKETKPVSEYWKNKSTKDGYQTWCKICWYAMTKSSLDGDTREKYLRMRRNGHLVRKYGITADEYDKLFESQGGVCAICGKDSERIAFAVDHDHDTGKVRGILCENCNRGLGMFRDNPSLLSSAIDYLS